MTTSVNLLQEKVFRAGDESTVVETLESMLPIACANVLQTPIRRKEHRQWENVCIFLKAPTPTFHSQLIDVNYQIEIEVKARWINKPVRVRMPILVSTVPIFNRFENVLDALFPGNYLEESERDIDEHSDEFPDDNQLDHNDEFPSPPDEVVVSPQPVDHESVHSDPENPEPSPSPPPADETTAAEPNTTGDGNGNGGGDGGGGNGDGGGGGTD